MSNSNRTVVTVGPLASASANNIITSITPTSGTALTLTGSTVNASGVAVLDSPRRILLTFGNEVSNRTLVITGTNSDNNPIQETLTVASGAGGTVATVQDFATVTKALPLGGGWSNAISVGTNTSAGTTPRFQNINFGPMNVEIACVVNGTVTYQAEYTVSSINSNSNRLGSQALGNYPGTPTWFVHPTLNAKSVNADGQITWPVTAVRITITSGTGSVTATIASAGIGNM